MRNKWILILVAMLVFVAAATGSWFYFKSTVIRVWVYTDYAFRFHHPDWTGVIQARFKQANDIFRRNGTGVRFQVLDTSQIDPTSEVPGIDSRRATMAIHLDRATDIYVILTGLSEGTRTGSVSPFTNVAVIEDFPGQTETLNSRLLAHELAHLFGAPHDPEWLETLMANKPETAKFSPRTVELIRRMRDYPFASGINGLAQDKWEDTAFKALAEDDTSQNTNAIAHAHTVLGMALLNERKRERAIVHFRQALAADPKSKAAQLNLIEAFTRNGQEEDGLAQARELVKMYPNDAMAHRALGAMLGRNHQPEAGVQELAAAAKLEPGNPDNQILMGSELAGMFGHLDDAIAALDVAVKLDPNSNRARESLEKTETLKQAVSASIERERALVRANPNDPDATYRLARGEARMGDFKNAIHDFQKAAELNPQSASPHMELAQLYIVTGDSKTAWDEVKKARELGTEPPPELLARLPAQK